MLRVVLMGMDRGVVLWREVAVCSNRQKFVDAGSNRMRHELHTVSRGIGKRDC